MADIHIGKISQTKEGKGKVDLVYHIPIESAKGGSCANTDKLPHRYRPK